jgi:hypothetical protein
LQFPAPKICVYSCLPRRSLGVGGSIRGCEVFGVFGNDRIGSFFFEKSLVNCETSGHTQPPFCRQTTEEKL